MPIPLGTTHFDSKVSSFLQIQRLSCSEQPKDVKRHRELLHIDNYCNILLGTTRPFEGLSAVKVTSQSNEKKYPLKDKILSKAALYTYMCWYTGTYPRYNRIKMMIMTIVKMLYIHMYRFFNIIYLRTYIYVYYFFFLHRLCFPCSEQVP